METDGTTVTPELSPSTVEPRNPFETASEPSSPVPLASPDSERSSPHTIAEMPMAPLRHTTSVTNRTRQEDTVVFDDDETTEPSSAANTADNYGEQPQQGHNEPPSSITRFLGLLTNTGQNPETEEDDDNNNMLEGSLICGYLQKLGRNGKWQARWFESDGECLSYYKSKKRVKLLATLDLEKVGAIEIDESDEKGLSFTIQVLGRLYLLRAESRSTCKDWVIMLNRIKEARLQQGNVKLINPAFPQPPDLLDENGNVTPRVVVVANRQRTRAVAESQDFSSMMATADARKEHEARRTALGTVVLARWTKRRTSIERLGAKLAKWARSLKRYSCTEVEPHNVHLDHYLHPPGHDDNKRGRTRSSDHGLSNWIGKETSRTTRQNLPDKSSEFMTSKPATATRGASDASEDIRMLS